MTSFDELLAWSSRTDEFDDRELLRPGDADSSVRMLFLGEDLDLLAEGAVMAA